MQWKAFTDYHTPTKVADDEPSACSACCSVVPAGESWTTEDDEKAGWMICGDCHARYLEDPLAAWQKAQDRWDTDGPCAKSREDALERR